MDNPNEDPIHKIESGLAHLERQYEELNRVVIEQGRILVKLQKQCQHLVETLNTIEADRIRETNPVPPHYGKK
jgi:uncharacterized coiled-coil protein SlyX